MNDPHIKIEYGDTPEKLHSQADEVIAYLVENLRKIDAISDKYTQINRQVYSKLSAIRDQLRLSGAVEKINPSYAAQTQRLEEQLSQGARVNGVRYLDEGAVRKEYWAQYDAAASVFCTEKLRAKGYYMSMALRNGKCSNRYAYLNSSCTLTISMKSARRAVVVAEYFMNDVPDLVHWDQFTLICDDGWYLDSVKYKHHEADRWKGIYV